MSRIGIDIVNNERIADKLSDSFLRHVLSEEEMKEYALQKDRISYVSGRFAAKEAILKCLIDKKISDMTKISITNGSFGEPIVHYEGYNLQVSISHEMEYTVAVALLDSKNE